MQLSAITAASPALVVVALSGEGQEAVDEEELADLVWQLREVAPQVRWTRAGRPWMTYGLTGCRGCCAELSSGGGGGR
jgi:hypothetical protein